jgi:hypothetical protein
MANGISACRSTGRRREAENIAPAYATKAIGQPVNHHRRVEAKPWIQDIARGDHRHRAGQRRYSVELKNALRCHHVTPLG